MAEQRTPGTQSVPGQTTDTTPSPLLEHPEALRQLFARFPDCWVPPWRYADGIATAAVRPDQLVEIVRWLRHESTPRYDLLVDILGAHWPRRELPFEVTYLFHSLETNARLRLKCSAGAENPTLPSLTDTWPATNWPEREIWDMFGVTFEGHPDLRRLLTPLDWEGHPLRKDFPLGEEPVEFYLPTATPRVRPSGGAFNPPIA